MKTILKKQNRVTDMTTGEPIRLILMFTIPLLIGDIFQQMYTMADTMVVGHALGDSAIAAIGGVQPLYNLIVYFSIGLNEGYQIILTQKFGAHNDKEFKQALAGMLMLSVVVTVGMTVLALATITPVMRFMNIPESIFADAYSYIFVIYAGMIFTVGYNTFASILRAVGNSRIPLYYLILASVLNVILDLVFVMKFCWGLVGAASATIMAQGMSAILCGIYIWKNYRDILPEKEHFKVPRQILRALVTTGFSMAMMEALVSLGTIIFQRANNVFGESVMAAYTSARRIIDMLMRPMFTLAAANCIFAGQNWGAGKVKRIDEALKKVLIVETLWSVFAAALVYLWGEELIRFTTGTADTYIIANAVLSMRIHLVCYPVLGVLICLRTVMQAKGRKIAPVASSGIELGMKIFSAAYLIPKFGFVGTCVTEPVTWVFMMSFLIAAYAWQKKDEGCPCQM